MRAAHRPEHLETVVHAHRIGVVQVVDHRERAGVAINSEAVLDLLEGCGGGDGVVDRVAEAVHRGQSALTLAAW